MYYYSVLYFLSPFLCMVETALSQNKNIEIPTLSPTYEDDEKPSNDIL